MAHQGSAMNGPYDSIRNVFEGSLFLWKIFWCAWMVESNPGRIYRRNTGMQGNCFLYKHPASRVKSFIKRWKFFQWKKKWHSYEWTEAYVMANSWYKFYIKLTCCFINSSCVFCGRKLRLFNITNLLVTSVPVDPNKVFKRTWYTLFFAHKYWISTMNSLFCHNSLRCLHLCYLSRGITLNSLLLLYLLVDRNFAVPALRLSRRLYLRVVKFRFYELKTTMHPLRSFRQTYYEREGDYWANFGWSVFKVVRCQTHSIWTIFLAVAV